jgi:hypothetical protein
MSITANFSLKTFTRRVEKAIICPIWTKTFEKSKKNSKFLDFLTIFSIFDAEARLGALKILKSRRTKVVSIKYLHLLRLKA